MSLLREECPQLRGRELSAAVPDLDDSRYTGEERELSDEPALGEEHIGAVEEGRERRARRAAAERRFESGRGPPQHECAQLRAADAATAAAARTAKRSRHRIFREEKQAVRYRKNRVWHMGEEGGSGRRFHLLSAPHRRREYTWSGSKKGGDIMGGNGVFFF